MSHVNDYSYLGSGIILIREHGSNAAFVEIGNCSAFSVAPQVNSVTLADYTNPGGGIQNRVDRVTDWNLSYTFHSFNADNFARATRGKATAVVAGTVTDEAAWAYKGTFVPLKYSAKTVTNVEPAGGGTPFVAGTDYVLERGMLWIPADSAITNATSAANIEVTYTNGDIEHVEGAVTSQKYYEMRFLGANEARSGKAVTLVAHKVSGGMIESLALLGDEFGGSPVTGSLIADPAKALTADTSKYFYWQQEK
jgi:hypothetical protein